MENQRFVIRKEVLIKRESPGPAFNSHRRVDTVDLIGNLVDIGSCLFISYDHVALLFG
jgi:hypothetical protein